MVFPVEKGLAGQLRYFRPIQPRSFRVPVPDHTLPESLMAKRIFDQAELKSAKAQRFADAFAGCDEWIELPPRRRGLDSDREDFDFQGEVGFFDQYLGTDTEYGRDRRAA